MGTTDHLKDFLFQFSHISSEILKVLFWIQLQVNEIDKMRFKTTETLFLVLSIFVIMACSLTAPVISPALSFQFFHSAANVPQYKTV